MTMVTAFKMTFGITEEKQCLEVTYAIYHAIGMLTGMYIHSTVLPYSYANVSKFELLV